jgi:hypothetical protein
MSPNCRSPQSKPHGGQKSITALSLPQVDGVSTASYGRFPLNPLSPAGLDMCQIQKADIITSLWSDQCCIRSAYPLYPSSHSRPRTRFVIATGWSTTSARLEHDRTKNWLGWADSLADSKNFVDQLELELAHNRSIEWRHRHSAVFQLRASFPSPLISHIM